MFAKKTIKDVDVTDKTVLLRTDYNVPLKNGKVADDYRIEASLPTIQYLLERNVRLIVCSHLGRPEGKHNASESLLPVAERLAHLVGRDKVQFIPDCIGKEVDMAVEELKPGHLLLLENLRFYPGEEANDPEFAKQLVHGAQLFVQDGFAVVHREHASTEAITHLLPSVAGFLVEKEVATITDVMENPQRPLMAVVGGAKVADKIDVLHRFIDLADVLAIGGAMANTFLAAEGINVGSSLIAVEDIGIAKDIMAMARTKMNREHFVFYLPQDGVVAHRIDKTAPTRIVDWSAHVISDIEHYPKRVPHEASQIKPNEMILDVGPFSGAFIAGVTQLANTVVWNGTMGVTETAGLQGPVGPYAHGTQLVVEAMLGQFGHRPFSLVGGGDTTGYVEQMGLMRAFDHVSTGGGASLELMAGRKLPGIEALEDK